MVHLFYVFVCFKECVCGGVQVSVCVFNKQSQSVASGSADYDGLMRSLEQIT